MGKRRLVLTITLAWIGGCSAHLSAVCSATSPNVPGVLTWLFGTCVPLRLPLCEPIGQGLSATLRNAGTTITPKRLQETCTSFLLTDLSISSGLTTGATGAGWT